MFMKFILIMVIMGTYEGSGTTRPITTIQQPCGSSPDSCYQIEKDIKDQVTRNNGKVMSSRVYMLY